MKTEKNNKLRGTVLFTVVAVMALLIIFLTGTLALATASSNRAHKSYSSSQASYTAKTAIVGFTQAMRTNSDISDKIISLGVGGNASVIHPTLSFKNGSNEDKSMGLVGFWGDDGIWHNNQITIEREMMLDEHNATVPKTQWDYDEETGQWIQTEKVKITATARVAKEESTVTAYLTKKAPSTIKKQKTGSGGIKGLNTVGDGVFENGGRYTGGIGLGLSKSGMKMENGKKERIQYRLNNAIELDTTLSFINADLALMTGNFSINVCQAAERPVSQTIINGSLWTKNDTLVELDYQMDSDFTQKEVPYLYVNGAMCFDSQGEIVRYKGEAKGKYEHSSQPASPYNVFVGTISAKSNNFILHGDLYLMDEYDASKKYMVKGENDIVTDANGNQGITYGDNVFGKNNSSQLYKWASDTLNKTDSQHKSFGGNIYCNGNLTLGGGTFDGDIKVKGDLIINGDTTVHGNVVVAGKLKKTGGTLTVDGKVYANNPDGYSGTGEDPETYKEVPNIYEGPEELKGLSPENYPSNYTRVDFEKREKFVWAPGDHKTDDDKPTSLMGDIFYDQNTLYYTWKYDYAKGMTIVKDKTVENELSAVYQDELAGLDTTKYEIVADVDAVIEELENTHSTVRTPEQLYVINNFIDVDSVKHDWDVGEKEYFVHTKIERWNEDGTPVYRGSSEPSENNTYVIYDSDKREFIFDVPRYYVADINGNRTNTITDELFSYYSNKTGQRVSEAVAKAPPAERQTSPDDKLQPYNGQETYPEKMTREAIYGTYTGGAYDGAFTPATTNKLIKNLQEVRKDLGLDPETGDMSGYPDSIESAITTEAERSSAARVAWKNNAPVANTSIWKNNVITSSCTIQGKVDGKVITINPQGKDIWVILDNVELDVEGDTRGEIRVDRNFKKDGDATPTECGKVQFIIKGTLSGSSGAIVNKKIVDNEPLEIDMHSNPHKNTDFGMEFYGVAGSKIILNNYVTLSGTFKCPYTDFTSKEKGVYKVKYIDEYGEDWSKRSSGQERWKDQTEGKPVIIGNALFKDVKETQNNFGLFYTETGQTTSGGEGNDEFEEFSDPSGNKWIFNMYSST